MPVKEGSREAELKAQVADLKENLRDTSAQRDNLQKELKKAQVAAAEGEEIKDALEVAKGDLAQCNARCKALEGALADAAKQAEKDAEC